MIIFGFILILIACFFLGHMFSGYDDFSYKVFFISLIGLTAIFLNFNQGRNICLIETMECRNSVNANKLAEKKEKAIKDRENNTPELVATAPDGTRLYILYKNNHHPVYFSSKGTHTTHSERHGKTTRTVDDNVSNGE